MSKEREDQERFWRKVGFDGPLPQHCPRLGACWIWQGAILKGCGYGVFFLNGKNRRAHRVAWQLTKGSVDTTLFVCHHCDNPACVRHSHLFLGTNSENMVDCVRKGRNPNKEKTHCSNGHSYSTANTAYNKLGWRRCITCRKKASQRLCVKRKLDRAIQRNARISG